MKQLLMLTDFSDSAARAATAALPLAARLRATIRLYHTLPFFPLVPGGIGGPYVTETEAVSFGDNKERLLLEADRLRECAVMAGCHVRIEEISGEGSLREVIRELTESPEVILVVMGGRKGSSLDHMLSGSDTASVIRKSSKPVLVVPAAIDFTIPQKVIFACDFSDTDIPAISYLDELSLPLGFELDVVHIGSHDKSQSAIGAEISLRKFLDHRQLNYSQEPAANVRDGLLQYCHREKAGLLAMAHGMHSFIDRLFNHSETQAVLSFQQLAVLAFPPGFQFTAKLIS